MLKWKLGRIDSGGKSAYRIRNALKLGVKVPRAMTYTAWAQALYGMEFPQLFLWPGLIRFTEQVCVEYQDITDADEHEIFQVCRGLFFISAFLIFLYRGFNLEWLSRYQVSLLFNLSNQQTSSTHFSFLTWRKTASHKQPSCKLHPRTPNYVFEGRRMARRWLARLGP